MQGRVRQDDVAGRIGEADAVDRRVEQRPLQRAGRLQLARVRRDSAGRETGGHAEADERQETQQERQEVVGHRVRFGNREVEAVDAAPATPPATGPSCVARRAIQGTNMIVPIGPEPPVASIAAEGRREVPRSPSATTDGWFRARPPTVDHRRAVAIRRSSEMDVAVACAHLTPLSGSVPASGRPCRTQSRRTTTKAAKSASIDRHVEDARRTNQASGIRSSLAPTMSWFVGYQRSGAVRLSPCIVQPVLPLPPTIRWMTTCPPPISSLRHPVGDDLADVVARLMLDEDEIAGVEACGSMLVPLTITQPARPPRACGSPNQSSAATTASGRDARRGRSRGRAADAGRADTWRGSFPRYFS